MQHVSHRYNNHFVYVCKAEVISGFQDWNPQDSLAIRCRNGVYRTYICVPFVGDLDNNNKADILKELSHLHFTHLTELRVSHNHIYSVERLT